jgi:hypothetical protein
MARDARYVSRNIDCIANRGRFPSTPRAPPPRFLCGVSWPPANTTLDPARLTADATSTSFCSQELLRQISNIHSNAPRLIEGQARKSAASEPKRSAKAYLSPGLDAVPDPASVKSCSSSASLSLMRLTDSSVVSTQPSPRSSPVRTFPDSKSSSCCCRLPRSCLLHAIKRPGAGMTEHPQNLFRQPSNIHGKNTQPPHGTSGPWQLEVR